MNQLLPHRFLFRYSFEIPHAPALPRSGRRLLNLGKNCVLPDFAELDREENFGDVSLAWNQQGLGISLRVKGKRQPLETNQSAPTESDGLQVWIDTRNARNIHRAGRFCHHFCLIPQGSGKDGSDPLVVQRPIARAREDAPEEHADEIQLASDVTSGGYLLEAWFPAAALHGFDPDASRQLGFYYYLRDAELGDQWLSVGPEFPFAHDPSLWATIELTD
jgi:hypothetical protein